MFLPDIDSFFLQISSYIALVVHIDFEDYVPGKYICPYRNGVLNEKQHISETLHQWFLSDNVMSSITDMNRYLFFFKSSKVSDYEVWIYVNFGTKH